MSYALTCSVGAVLVVVRSILYWKRPEVALLLFGLVVGTALLLQLLHVLECAVDPLTLQIKQFMRIKKRNQDLDVAAVDGLVNFSYAHCRHLLPDGETGLHPSPPSHLHPNYHRATNHIKQHPGHLSCCSVRRLTFCWQCSRVRLLGPVEPFEPKEPLLL